MSTCPSCSMELPDEARFCLGCGARMAAPVAKTEERKTVTTLFCDLVAFTAMSEAADPEDVDRLLGEYFARATKVIEAHGGTLEKFIGDAVVGVFGVPAVHEDDPERAVRAALRLLEALGGMTRPDGSPLEARCGVNTGEALVRLDVDLASGRGFLIGDAVNAAARLQAAAPPMGVAVGALTHELTQRAFVYTDLPPVAVKGKAEPVVAWLAVTPVARTGAQIDRESLTPFVGRAAELATIRGLFDAAVASATPRFCLVAGESGVCKSRLVAELFAGIDAGPELVTWRQGRCLPYGEGVTFSALAEIVKAHAGILDTDDAAQAGAKLAQVVPAGPDCVWIVTRLRALAGLEAPQAGAEENFAAWLRFLEGVADVRPLVVVLEDLHWADQGLLDFVHYVSVHAGAGPLLLLCTARSEVLDRDPALARDGGGIACVLLEPLARDETERLVGSLVGGPGASPEQIQALAARCAGNPFFAEECARLLADVSDESLVPASVQAVVAARLDALPGDEKALLGDAAVVGMQFWSGAVAQLGARTEAGVRAAVSELVGRHLVRRARESSMGGQEELVFANALVRDVAYSQLPRRERATRHVAAARWLETVVGERTGDLAETLAHHYTTALELARGCGDAELADSLTAPALLNLRLAGLHAGRFDMARGADYFARGLALATDEHERAELLGLHANNLLALGRNEEAADEYAQVVEALRGCGSDLEVARALFGRSSSLIRLNDPGWLAPVEEAQRLLEGVEPSAEHVKLWTRLAATNIPLEDDEATLYWAERAIGLAERLGMPEAAQALGWRGWARAGLGDRGGIDDMRRAAELADAQGNAFDVAGFAANAAEAVWWYDGPRAALPRLREAEKVGRARCVEEAVTFARVVSLIMLVNAGDWGVARDELAGFPGSALESACNVLDLMSLGTVQAFLESASGDGIGAGVDWLRVEALASSQTDLAAAALVACGVADIAGGDAVQGARMLALRAALPGVHRGYVEMLPAAVRAALAVGDSALAERLVGDVESPVPLLAHARVTGLALLAEAAGEHEAAAAGFADAAARWRDFGMPYEEGHALFGQGRCLAALGHAPEAATPLAAARDIFARLGARPALEESEAALGTLAAPQHLSRRADGARRAGPEE